MADKAAGGHVSGQNKAVYLGLSLTRPDARTCWACGSSRPKAPSKFPPIAAACRRQWTQVIPSFAYHQDEVRKIIYTTNATESLHMQLRKIVKNRHFPGDEASTKLLYLASREGMEDAASNMERGGQLIRHHVRRTITAALN